MQGKAIFYISPSSTRTALFVYTNQTSSHAISQIPHTPVSTAALLTFQVFYDTLIVHIPISTAALFNFSNFLQYIYRLYWYKQVSLYF